MFSTCMVHACTYTCSTIMVNGKHHGTSVMSFNIQVHNGFFAALASINFEETDKELSSV